MEEPLSFLPGRALFRVLPAGLLLGIGLCMGPATGSAQNAASGVSGGGGVEFQLFQFSDEDAVALRSVSLLSVPLAVRISLVGGMDLDVSGAFARGEIERPDGTTTTLSGPTDTRLRLGTDELLDQRLSLAAIAVLPTGTSSFSGEEAALAGILAADLLPFNISSWGSGGGLGAEAAFIHTTGFGNVSVGGAFVVPGEFDPLEGQTFGYRPGPVLQVQAGVDRDVGSASRLTVQAAFQRYGEDQLEGQNLFRSGNRIQFVGSYAFPVGATGSSIAYGGYLHRTEGTYLESLENRPSQGLFYAGIGLRRPWAGFVLAPSAEVRVLRREGGEDQGLLAGVGTSVEVPAGGMLVVPSVRVRFGSAVIREGSSSSFVGFDAGLRLRRGGER
ncbi:MAG: hypothetical protein WD960_09670 [Gemmatimonadota bacterium]